MSLRPDIFLPGVIKQLFALFLIHQNPYYVFTYTRLQIIIGLHIITVRCSKLVFIGDWKLDCVLYSAHFTTCIASYILSGGFKYGCWFLTHLEQCNRRACPSQYSLNSTFFLQSYDLCSTYITKGSVIFSGALCTLEYLCWILLATECFRCLV